MEKNLTSVTMNIRRKEVRKWSPDILFAMPSLVIPMLVASNNQMIKMNETTPV